MSLLDDFAILAGGSAIVYAAYQVHPALAWCVGGFALVLFGVMGARMRGGKEAE